MSDTDTQAKSSVTANRSVSRAISVLRVLAGSSDPLTATEIANRVKLPRATAFRLLVTLEEEGFVDRKDTHYSLGWDLARIARSVDPTTGFVPRVKNILEDLADELDETVTLSLRHGTYELELVLQEAPRSIGVRVSDLTGLKWPLHASATGKLLLADFPPETVRRVTGEKLDRLAERTITSHAALRKDLDLVRSRGWAEINDELEDGIYSLAVPIRDKNEDIYAILSLVAPKHRIEHDDSKNDQLEKLLAGAETLRRQLSTPN